MPGQSEPNSDESTKEAEAVSCLKVAGFKSIREERSIGLRPLTVLAGANSAGKSSIMQPFLLLKQTLEASYDPPPLVLDGPNVEFTKAEQLLSRTDEGTSVSGFQVQAGMDNGDSVVLRFKRQKDAGFAIEEMRVISRKEELPFREGMSPDAVGKLFGAGAPAWKIIRERCFLKPILMNPEYDDRGSQMFWRLPVIPFWRQWLRGLIHVPALRGTRGRTYLVTAVGETFPGRFDNYVASILAKWQIDGRQMALGGVFRDLNRLGLAWTLLAKHLNDVEVEILVNRLPTRSGRETPDLVSIADVGFGVSQMLPVVVALHAAKKGQAVYIEQPEIHLHPRAQVALATVLADAAKRGVQVIIETHSRTLLLALQTLVAKGELPTQLINLHWFTRDATNGTTTIRSAELDEAGAFGDWPEDFAQVEMDLESSYLDAAEARVSGGRGG